MIKKLVTNIWQEILLSGLNTLAQFETKNNKIVKTVQKLFKCSMKGKKHLNFI